VSGSPGVTGPKGISGATGSSGTSGQTGDAGPQGPTGPTGPQGQSGPVGSSGAKGSIGDTGTPGNAGKCNYIKILSQVFFKKYFFIIISGLSSCFNLLTYFFNFKYYHPAKCAYLLFVMSSKQILKKINLMRHTLNRTKYK